MARVNYKTLPVHGVDIPIKIYKEWRSNVRVSVGKRQLILRIPYHATETTLKKHMEWAQKWFEKKLKSKPDLLDFYKPHIYNSGDTICTATKEYKLEINSYNNKRNIARIKKKGVIEIYVGFNQNEAERREIIQKLLQKIIALDHLQEMRQRVHEINKKYFNKKIGKISLRYNVSNWGSCSAKSNISLSTRLVFAPIAVQNYIIIHELAHLLEMNHSKKYWSIVEKIDPHYREKEKWLNENGNTCRI